MNCIYISADLSRASSVLDSTSLPTTSSPSHPSKQGPTEDISPASPGSQAAGIEESYPPGTQAAGIQDLGARMLRSYHLICFSRGSTRLQQPATSRPGFWPRIHQPATARHRPPGVLAQNPTNHCESVLLPAQEWVPRFWPQNPANLKKSVHPSIHSSGPRGRRQRRQPFQSAAPRQEVKKAC